MSTAWEDDGPATAALCNCFGTDAAGTNRTAGTRAREALQLVPNTAIAAFVLLLPASAVLAAALQLSSSPGVLLQLWTPRWAGAGSCQPQLPHVLSGQPEAAVSVLAAAPA